MPDTSPARRRFPALQLAVALFLLLLVLDGLAVMGIVRAQREARSAALEELQRRAEVQARGCEAALATLRADLVFLAGSTRLEEVFRRRQSDDPIMGRWARLELESTLLQFAEGHPGLVALGLGTDAAGVWVARDAGVPQVVSERPMARPGALELDLPVGSEVLRLSAGVAPSRVLEAVAPGLGGELVAVPVIGDDEGQLVVSEPVEARGWTESGQLHIVRREQGGRLFGTIETLASRYRTTVLLNVVVLSLTLPLALLAVREARRAERLTAATELERDRREMERQLWHQERLATVGRLAAGLAHEINNPLSGVSNHLVLLGEDLDSGRQDEARRRLPKLRQGIERMASTVRRALELGTPGGSGRDHIDLADLVSETVELISGHEEGVDVRVSRELERAVLVEGDRAALAQVVTNLVLNAIQMQPEGGEVDVRISSEGDEARLEVADRGPGIGEEVAERLFEPFVSGRGSTGLGLSVSHGIVVHHGGQIEAENREGGGARFVVSLPRVVTGAPAGDSSTGTEVERAS